MVLLISSQSSSSPQSTHVLWTSVDVQWTNRTQNDECGCRAGSVRNGDLHDAALCRLLPTFACGPPNIART
jgi:hypothetical protein